MNLRIKGLLSK